MEPLQIAIDGPVASGKSTVAARLAQRMHCAFLDTGALYRSVAWLALERGASVDDERSVLALLDQEMPVIASPGPDGRAVIVASGRELGNELFTPEVSRAVSLIAAMPGVRDRLVPAQRGFADKRSVVMAGRDIGTVILPNASIKFFLTATLDERVGRRQRELEARGLEIDGDALRAQVMRRDARDTGRDVSPLAKAPDAIEVDTTDMTFDEVVDELERLVRAATASRA
ncbi:MAG TPA: (d)CMP kinase [Candidatus Binatus sp.]|nr:(d)CMP kinase [Candidatus Binatus sp.]